jgi:glucose-1-phosphate thymidylyltransferase
MENMKNAGTAFYPGTVDEWLDCGNKNATVYTNQRLLDFKKSAPSRGKNLQVADSSIIEPCYIGDNVILSGSVVGPYVSLGDGSQVLNSVITGSIIQDHSVIRNTVLSNSMIGKHVILNGHAEEFSIGDYTQVNSSK